MGNHLKGDESTKAFCLSVPDEEKGIRDAGEGLIPVTIQQQFIKSSPNLQWFVA